MKDTRQLRGQIKKELGGKRIQFQVSSDSANKTFAGKILTLIKDGSYWRLNNSFFQLITP